MARRKRTSSVLEAAHQRMAGLSSISPTVDFGSGLSLAAFSSQIDGFSTKLDHYNQMVATVDELQNQIDAEEDSLREMTRRMLAAAQAHYGPNSNQYEQAGGKRVQDRKLGNRNKTPEKNPKKKPTSPLGAIDQPTD